MQDLNVISLDAFGKKYCAASYNPNAPIIDSYFEWARGVGVRKTAASLEKCSSHIKISLEENIDRSLEDLRIWDTLPKDVDSVKLWTSDKYESDCVICCTIRECSDKKINTKNITKFDRIGLYHQVSFSGIDDHTGLQRKVRTFKEQFGKLPPTRNLRERPKTSEYSSKPIDIEAASALQESWPLTSKDLRSSPKQTNIRKMVSEKIIEYSGERHEIIIRKQSNGDENMNPRKLVEALTRFGKVETVNFHGSSLETVKTAEVNPEDLPRYLSGGTVTEVIIPLNDHDYYPSFCGNSIQNVSQEVAIQDGDEENVSQEDVMNKNEENVSQEVAIEDGGEENGPQEDVMEDSDEENSSQEDVIDDGDEENGPQEDVREDNVAVEENGSQEDVDEDSDDINNKNEENGSQEDVIDDGDDVNNKNEENGSQEDVAEDSDDINNKNEENGSQEDVAEDSDDINNKNEENGSQDDVAEDNNAIEASQEDVAAKGSFYSNNPNNQFDDKIIIKRAITELPPNIERTTSISSCPSVETAFHTNYSDKNKKDNSDREKYRNKFARYATEGATDTKNTVQAMSPTARERVKADMDQFLIGMYGHEAPSAVHPIRVHWSNKSPLVWRQNDSFGLQAHTQSEVLLTSMSMICEDDTGISDINSTDSPQGYMQWNRLYKKELIKRFPVPKKEIARLNKKKSHTMPKFDSILSTECEQKEITSNDITILNDMYTDHPAFEMIPKKEDDDAGPDYLKRIYHSEIVHDHTLGRTYPKGLYYAEHFVSSKKDRCNLLEFHEEDGENIKLEQHISKKSPKSTSTDEIQEDIVSHSSTDEDGTIPKKLDTSNDDLNSTHNDNLNSSDSSIEQLASDILPKKSTESKFQSIHPITPSTFTAERTNSDGTDKIIDILHQNSTDTSKIQPIHPLISSTLTGEKTYPGVSNEISAHVTFQDETKIVKSLPSDREITNIIPRSNEKINSEIHSAVVPIMIAEKGFIIHSLISEKEQEVDVTFQNETEIPNTVLDGEIMSHLSVSPQAKFENHPTVFPEDEQKENSSNNQLQICHMGTEMEQATFDTIINTKTTLKQDNDLNIGNILCNFNTEDSELSHSSSPLKLLVDGNTILKISDPDNKIIEDVSNKIDEITPSNNTDTDPTIQTNHTNLTNATILLQETRRNAGIDTSTVPHLVAPIQLPERFSTPDFVIRSPSTDISSNHKNQIQLELGDNTNLQNNTSLGYSPSSEPVSVTELKGPSLPSVCSDVSHLKDSLTQFTEFPTSYTRFINLNNLKQLESINNPSEPTTIFSPKSIDHNTRCPKDYSPAARPISVQDQLKPRLLNRQLNSQESVGTQENVTTTLNEYNTSEPMDTMLVPKQYKFVYPSNYEPSQNQPVETEQHKNMESCSVRFEQFDLTSNNHDDTVLTMIDDLGRAVKGLAQHSHNQNISVFELQESVKSISNTVQDIALQVRANTEALSILTDVVTKDHIRFTKMFEQHDKLLNALNQK